MEQIWSCSSTLPALLETPQERQTAALGPTRITALGLSPKPRHGAAMPAAAQRQDSRRQVYSQHRGEVGNAGWSVPPLTQPCPWVQPPAEPRPEAPH